MARRKQYNEDEVIEKATNLFWKNGFEATSMQMLEKEMGINKFSIYASFGNKDGVFVECIKNYTQKIAAIKNTLKKSNNGHVGIKQYFVDFIEFSKEAQKQKGCLITNTFNEAHDAVSSEVTDELSCFIKDIKELIENNVRQDNNNETFVNKQTNYLMISLYGLASASKVFDQDQLKDYINNIFCNS